MQCVPIRLSLSIPRSGLSPWLVPLMGSNFWLFSLSSPTARRASFQIDLSDSVPQEIGDACEKMINRKFRSGYASQNHRKQLPGCTAHFASEPLAHALLNFPHALVDLSFLYYHTFDDVANESKALTLAP